MLKLRKILLFKRIYIIIFFLSLCYLGICLNINYTSKYDGSEEVIIGTITSLEYKGNKMTLVIKAKEKLIANYFFDTKEHLIETKNNLSLGDTIKLKGTLKEPFANQNFYAFSYRTFLLHKKIFYLMTIDTFEIIKKNNNIINDLRTFVRNKVKDDKVDSYINVFFLGIDTNFSLKLQENLQKLGISHLFALSGTQITFLIFIIEKILSILKLDNLKKYFFTTLLIFIYYLLIENCAAIDRAIIFYLVFSFNKTFNLQIKPFFLILLSLSILIFINPFYIYDIGFQYSTTITITLILYMNNKEVKGKIIELLKVSWVSFLVSLPISLYHFSYINILSIIYNLFYVPFINILIFPFSIICFFLPGLNFILEFFINIFELTVNFLANIKFGIIVFKRLPFIFYLLYYLIIISYFYFSKKKKIFLILLCSYLIIHNNINRLFPPDRLYMLDVGQGDSFLFISNNKSLLVDTGGVLSYYEEEWKRYEKEDKAKYIVNFLYQLGIKDLDYLLLTHGDYDHAKEALNLLERIDIKTVFFNSNNLNNLEQEIYKKSKNKYKLQEGDLFSLGNFNFQVISPLQKDENAGSTVFLATINNNNLLFMGDAPKKSEDYILTNYNLPNILLLKVGHHGSKTSSSEEFIATIRPTYALISAGVDNKFNHPHQEVVDRLKKYNVIIYDVREKGMVMFDFKTNRIITKL